MMSESVVILRLNLYLYLDSAIALPMIFVSVFSILLISIPIYQCYKNIVNNISINHVDYMFSTTNQILQSQNPLKITIK